VKVAALVAGAGAGGTLLASFALGDSTLEAVKLTAAAGGAAAGAGFLGALLLYAARHSSIAVQSVLVALTPIGAVAAGAMAAAHLMMVAPRPIVALGVVLTSSGTVGILTSLVLGARLRTGSAQLITATRQIGGGDLRTRVERPPVEELAALARELEAMQFRLERSRARERELEGARRELVAWMSHDLRTPLARIQAIVEALADDVVAEPADVASSYSQLRAEADRLGTLVNDLLELNRISAGELELELERTNLTDIVSDLVASFAVIADARGLTLNARPPSVIAEVEVSTSHLERALANLLDNALRYTEPGGVVDVQLTVADDSATIAIADSCGGMDFDQLAQLLAEPNTAHRLGRGGRTGLGIAIAKGLVEAQGGQIAVERTDAGCRFVVTLRLAS
jgi:signal transduction histidine kinase